MRKEHGQPPSPAYRRKEVDEKPFTSQNKAVIQKSKLAPDNHVLNSDLSDGKNLKNLLRDLN